MESVSLFTTNLFSNTTQTAQSSQQTDTATVAASSTQDTVKLSAAAQAKMMYHQGESVTQIASSLGASTKTVDDYLGITVDEELEKAIESTLSTQG